MRDKIYISGAITGHDYDVAYHKFEDAETTVCQWAEAVNPMKLDVKIREGYDVDWCDYMLTDLDVLMRQCTGIYMLRDWRESKGARIEHAIAEIMGLKIFYEATR